MEEIEMLLGGHRGIGECCHLAGERYGLDQDLLPFAVEFGREQADTGGIATRPGE